MATEASGVREFASWRGRGGRSETANFAVVGDPRHRRVIAPAVSLTMQATDAPKVAIIDGPYNADALSRVLARAPLNLGEGSCGASPSSACAHGTFIIGLLGAREDAPIAGLCPDCELLHFPLFVDESAPKASVAELANAIAVAVAAGARLINLSLAIVNDDAEHHRKLAEALDYAEASGAIVVAAAGNQGRVATGQILSHPVTIPVVAVDAAGRLLRECNLGPSISRRGVAALGYDVLGYAPDGKLVKMSGSSPATANATGVLAQTWSACPDADGARVRGAVARLSPRNGPIPPILERDALLAALGCAVAPPSDRVSPPVGLKTNYVRLQGEKTMSEGNSLSRNSGRDTGPATISCKAVTPAQMLGGCACGGVGGRSCTCGNEEPSWRFVYVLGTVDVRFPDQSISEEMQRFAEQAVVANMLPPWDQQTEPLRNWYGRVLRLREARYIARQLCWILYVEGQPAYYLNLRDFDDFDELIQCLSEPKGDDLCLFVGSSSLIPVEACPGVTAPALSVDHLRRYHQAVLSTWIEISTGVAPTLPRTLKAYRTGGNTPIQLDLFNRLVQSADNFGDTDEWRALNYLAVQYPLLYKCYADMLHHNYTLESIRVMRSRLWGEKRIVDPVFAFRENTSGVTQKYFVRVDVSHLFPMLLHPLADYFDR